MKNKAFTLIELLAVIIIISILVTLSSLGVTKIMKRSKEQLNNYQKKSIIDAAKIVVGDNIDTVDLDDDCKYISLEYLINYGILDESITDVINNQNYYVKVCLDNSSVYNEDKLTYEIISDVNGLEPIFNE